ncbi:MAG: hypothetical protein LBS56_00105 [Propionibacteriaceae bacterium]|jgi:multidrug efflux pump subunit AcrA (membrane-fusion protein)|nr:hypothetical protein [Propionibacteriaceae bacterium]
MSTGDPGAPKAPSPLRRWRPAIIAAVATVVLVAGGVTAWTLGHGTDDKATDKELRTVAVERGSLAAGFKIPGTLGYGEASDLSSAQEAVVTKLPEAGQMISTGQVIMEIEGSPVFLLQGDLPLWRDIGAGVTGKDVANLRDALAKIGLDAGSGQAYDAALSQAIAQLYLRAGYAEPVAMAEDKVGQEAAKKALDQAREALADAQLGVTEAQQGLTEAQQALTAAKNAKPDEASLLQAQATADSANAVYQAALNGDCTLAGAQVCTDQVVKAARTQVDIAVAALNQLNQTPDTTMQERAVTSAERAVTTAQKGASSAQQAVTEAQKAYDGTLENTVGPKNILIVPEPQIRIDEVEASVGAPARGVILTWTKTTLYAQAELTAAQERMLATGMKATIVLKDATEVQGTVAEITEAHTDMTTYQSYPPSLRADVDDQATLAQLGPGAVTISFVSDEADDTLIVPVTALVVPAEGGYCVQVAEGGTTRYVRVEIGLIADTRVQILSGDLAEGDLVVVT